MNKIKIIFSFIFLSIFIIGCSNNLPSNVFISNPGSQKINNLSDVDGDKVSEIIFYNNSSMSKPGKYLETPFFEYENPINGKFHSIKLGDGVDTPVYGYFDDDSLLDFGFVRAGDPENLDWIIYKAQDMTSYGIRLGKPGDIPIPSDYDGDGKTDAVVYSPMDSNFMGYLSRTGGGFNFEIGESGSIPVSKDYDGDGLSDFGVYNRKNGNWKIRLSTNSSILNFNLGGINFLPIPSDFDGDGNADLCVWNFKNNSIDGIFSKDKTPFSEDIKNKIKNDLKDKFYFPIPGDYNGNKSSELAFYDEDKKLLITYEISDRFIRKVYNLNKFSNSFPVNNYLLRKFIIDFNTTSPLVSLKGNKHLIYFLNDEFNDLPINNKKLKKVITSKKWEVKNTIPFASDFDGDSVLDTAVYSKDTSTFIVQASRADIKFALQIGVETDMPVVGNLNADSIPDIGIYRPSEQKFLIRYLGKTAPIEIKEIKFNNVSSESIPILEDYDGDNIFDFAVFDRESKNFIIKKSINNEEVKIGFESDGVAISGDFDGDLKADPIVYVKEKNILIYESSKLNSKVEIKNLNLSGKIFTLNYDDDLISDIAAYENGILNIFQSSKNWKVEKITINKNARLVNVL